MLLLPLVMWWAREPMRFAARPWRRILLPTMILFLTAYFSVGMIRINPLVAQSPLVMQTTPESSRDYLSRTANASQRVELLREGTKINNVPGRIISVGQRWCFVPEMNGSAVSAAGFDDPGQPTGRTKSFCICENLILQRITDAVKLDPSDDRWTVNATLSVFEDQNFVLLLWAKRAPQRMVATESH